MKTPNTNPAANLWGLTDRECELVRQFATELASTGEYGHWDDLDGDALAAAVADAVGIDESVDLLDYLRFARCV